MNKIKIVICFIACFFTFSCDFLDVVPDNVPTIDHAFANRTEAQRYLYGLLGGMPDVGNYQGDPALCGSDELWISESAYSTNPRTLTRLLKGEQGPVDPLANYWMSRQNGYALNGGKRLWTTISDCNFFIENIHKPYDLMETERDKWIGEALFVKAYLHFWLFRQYGPIPLIKENLPIDTETETIMRYREPVDEVTDYIVSLLDQAIALLPLRLENETDEMGRPDQCIAAALKAQVLALAASPLFNCNPDYADYIDKRGVQLFPQDPEAVKDKWQKAAVAAKEAIDMAHEGLHRLYDAHTDFQTAAGLSEETILAMQVRGAVTERWNDELIWGNTLLNNHAILQRFCCPYFTVDQMQGSQGWPSWSPSLRMVEQFYTKNGLPIEDDEEWVGKDFWALRTATADERQYIREGRQTAALHFDREARFYGSIFFDQGTFFGNSQITTDNTANAGNLYVSNFKQGEMTQYAPNQRAPLTGYLVKKLLHYRSGASGTASYSNYNYAFPIIRLADIYLLYAEALNESLDAPNDDVYFYINAVRNRTGLKGVVESWRDHAVAGKKNLPATKEGMREIIRRERLNELAFEGARYWDIRRWKLAEDYLNRPIRGLSVEESDAADFFVETVLYEPKFEKKDYFTPIRTEILTINTNLLQSPGW